MYMPTCNKKTRWINNPEFDLNRSQKLISSSVSQQQ